MRAIVLVAVGVLAFALGGPGAHADHVGPLTPEEIAHADTRAGNKLATKCAACHGADGIATVREAPHLAGQHAIYLAGALDSYLHGLRGHTPMLEIVEGWNRMDLINVATHFSRLKPFAEMAPVPPEEGGSAAGAEAIANPFAETVADPLAEAREITQACAACHGADGNSTAAGMPSIAGQPAPYLETALRAYRDGKRKHQLMQSFTAQLGDADIDLMAAYYAAAEPRHRDESGDRDFAAGAAVAAACASCHGIDGNSMDPSIPRLAGLEPDYLVAAIRAYKDATRDHAAMTGFVQSLEETAIEEVAAFYAGQKPHPPAQAKRLTTGEWVERCNRCHGPDGDSANPKIPILTGQSQTYLANALRVYHTGERTHSTMRAMLFPLGETEFRGIASHYAGKRRN